MQFLLVCEINLIRDSFCNLFSNLEIGAGLNVLPARSLEEAKETLSTCPKIDLILFYHSLDLISWTSLKKICSLKNKAPVLVIADFKEESEVRNAILEGANGCVSTDFSWRTVSTVIQRILDGEIVCPSLSFKATTHPSPINSDQVAPITREAETARSTAPFQSLPIEGGLTPRQVEVLDLIRMGNSNKQIARHLGVAEGTVKIHCAAIFRYLGVSNRTQAAIAAENYFKSVRE